MKKQKTWCRTGALLAAALLSTALWVPGVSAAGEIKMSSAVGWDGTFKLSAPTFVQVTVENQGADVNGKLVVTPDNPNNGGNSIAGSFEKDVVVPKGSTKTFRIEVPGGLFIQAVKIKLLDEKGQELEYVRPTQVAIQEGILLGGITEKKDDLNVFSLVNAPAVGNKINLRWMKNADLPDRVDLLQGLDVLAINHAPQEKLTDEQVQTIRQWVERGGTLLLSGGPNYQGGAGLFQDLSPVQVNGTGKATDLSDLHRYTGSKPSVTELNVSNGTLVQGAQVLVQAGAQPLIAVRDVGAGHVYYAAYDLSEEPFASWRGNKDLWANVWRDANFPAGSFSAQSNGGFSDPTMLLVNSSQLFRDLIPAIKTSVLVFIGYVVLVGPLMYVVLRRTNRREWGWAMIPATALLFTGGILLFDNGPRTSSTRAQTTAVINLKTDQIAEIAAGSSYLVTSGGNYSVEFKSDAFVYPTGLNYGSSGNTEARTVLGDDKPRIHYENVEYWSMRSSYLQGKLSDQGRVQSDLKIDKSGHLIGKLVNNTKFDMEVVHLLIGNQPYKVEDLKAGSTQPIDLAINSSPAVVQPTDFGSQMFPYGIGSTNQENEQYRNLVNYATSPALIGTAQVQLLGFTNAPLHLYKIDGETVENDTALSLVRQDLPIAYEAGGTTLPAGMIRPQILTQEGQVYAAPEGIRMSIGSVVMQYNLKKIPGFAVEKVTTNLDSAAYAMFDKQLYNFKTGEWVLVAKENTPAIGGDLVAQFVSPEGDLRVKFSSTSPQDQYLPYPSVGLEGKVSQ
ncbi:DUF7408 domain-containing protein [Tumebacillus permanentifrigoris]|uniref:DUF7408 domain-containing protein n=1 Tax=Tumebacillus permanentifrigoris TaxID=378543 RepID=A0A316D9D2_9BACL|nr:DUF4350 domain-containing protein [Tumebacillus permanentifrigoris]PWK12838.1 hypothetical protein C7459_109200 [Tumebacillus permanentifrigoris]